VKPVNQTVNNVSVQSQNFDRRVNTSLEFGRILEQYQKQNSELKVSAHAMDRLNERKIKLTETDMAKLTNAVDSIRNKGGKEALILYNSVAFITSIRNNTIITAVDRESLKENVFTNIDSAMIL
jgi:flagellar operon protein